MSKRRIVVEHETYQWLVAADVVHIIHPQWGHKAWLRHPDEPVTPRAVAEFIYHEYLGREPPPRPIPEHATEKLLVPTVNIDQREVYLLVQQDYWFNEAGWLRGADRVIAGFTDPALAKLEADRRNPPYVRTVRAMRQPASTTEFFHAFGDQARDMVNEGFTLWNAIAMPLYGSRMVAH
jgi:hypothetical protein